MQNILPFKTSPLIPNQLSIIWESCQFEGSLKITTPNKNGVCHRLKNGEMRSLMCNYQEILYPMTRCFAIRRPKTQSYHGPSSPVEQALRSSDELIRVSHLAVIVAEGAKFKKERIRSLTIQGRQTTAPPIIKIVMRYKYSPLKCLTFY